MAERRMFAKNIVDSDLFLDMPITAQALYFHLGIRADDDGFIDNPKKIQRMVGASADDLKLLAAKQFIIPFESGVVVIRHWKIHNYIRGDRKKSTEYVEELSMLDETQNGAYCLAEQPCPSNDSQVTTDCQNRLGKDRLGKDRLGKDNSITDALIGCPEPSMFLEDIPVDNKKKRKKTYKNGLDNPDKVHYAESVALTPTEYQKLVNKFGETETTNLLEWFSCKKIAKGYIYASDYHALLNWGILEWQTSKGKYQYCHVNKQQSINDISKNLADMMGDDWDG